MLAEPRSASIRKPSLAWIAFSVGIVACSSEPEAKEQWDNIPKGEWEPANPIACSQDEGSVGTLLEELSAPDPMIPHDAYVSYGGRIEEDPVRLPFLGELQQGPLPLTCFASNLAARSDLSASSEHPRLALVADAVSAMGMNVEVGGTWPALDEGDPLLDALGRVGARFDATTRAEVSRVPPDLARAIAHLVLASVEAQSLRDEALAQMASAIPLEQLFEDVGPVFLGWNYSDTSLAPELDPGRDVDLYRRDGAGASLLYRGALRLAQAIDEIQPESLAGAAVPDDLALTVETRLGWVVVRGTRDDEYDAAADPRLGGSLLLVVDVGGNDVYRVPVGATTSATHGVSVHLDLGGDDVYTYPKQPATIAALDDADADGRYAGAGRGPFSLSRTGRQGSGRLGYGFLVDLGSGRDRYESLRMSQGFAALGVGLLWDDGGDDVYEAEMGSQASALGGVAILYDGGGNDRYRAFYMSQGFGAISSSALLYDRQGNDHYELVVDDVVLVGSSQTNGLVNLSLGQGTAMGWRDDVSGNHLGGGLALLRDASGDDAYVGGTFAQGTGYWMGVGVFADADGNDTYDAAFYGQGAAAHFAAAAFLESRGDDRYDLGFVPTQSCLGLGHDFSIGVAIDRRGADQYRAPAFALGASTCRGVGLFVDVAGQDAYNALAPETLGAAEDVCSAAPEWPTFGLFVDAAGVDVYEGARGGNASTWTTPPPSPQTPWFAGGLDDDAGNPGAFATIVP